MKRVIVLLKPSLIDAAVAQGIKEVVSDSERDDLAVHKTLGDIGKLIELRSKDDEEKVLAEEGTVLVQTKDWRVIPIENLIASAKAELIAVVNDADEAALMLGTLEKGVSGVVVPAETEDDLVVISKLLSRSDKLALSSAKVLSVEEKGMGDRVCLDFCSLLEKGEGALVGSTSGGLFLIHGETIETEWCATRPFRVNAGGLHSYVLMADGKTKYLSELKSGDEVLVVADDGSTRHVIVGRVKLEARPMTLVTASLGKKLLKILVQNAETIRFVSEKGPISVSELQAGDVVLVHEPEAGGRHFGTRIDEKVVER